VEWKKGPRPPVAAPTSPVKFDYFSLPVALDKHPSIGLAKEPGLGWNKRSRNTFYRVTVSIRRAALNTLVLNSAKVSRLHAIGHSERAGAFWLLDYGSDSCVAL
jgi:hypothetical protein